MPHYYLDIETTGLDPEEDEIISLQFQKIAVDTGEPIEPLNLLKSWSPGFSEEKIIRTIEPLILSSNPFSFVPVGNNLNFEFKFLASKFRKYLEMDIDASVFNSRPFIDLKPVMILLNGGRFKGYQLILKKSTDGSKVPIWYHNKEYDKIINYIKEEARVFTEFYSTIHHLMFNDRIRNFVFKNSIKRIDGYV